MRRVTIRVIQRLRFVHAVLGKSVIRLERYLPYATKASSITIIGKPTRSCLGSSPLSHGKRQRRHDEKFGGLLLAPVLVVTYIGLLQLCLLIPRSRDYRQHWLVNQKKITPLPLPSKTLEEGLKIQKTLKEWDMEKFKTYGLAVTKIGEKLLLIGVGLAGMWAVYAKIKDENLALVTLVIAGIALLFGLAPMIFNYAKSQWPK